MAKQKEITALKVKQWLSEWNRVRWNSDEMQNEPQHHFYQFSMSAADLKALSGVYSRTTDRPDSRSDLGIQRRHEARRSKNISKYIEYGYPWSELSEARRRSGNFSDLRKPGWLPTAIVINILCGKDVRRGKKTSERDLVSVEDQADGIAKIILPKGFTGSSWRAEHTPPIEVIDGQHRLWAFEDSDLKGDFELPVVAFVGLDISWQAYLFYTINIKPKKINASLAFDLYPLLRVESWLQKFEGHRIYKEARAQELVDMLWFFPHSPWHKKINMLGGSGAGMRMASQAAWIRALLATYIKSWEGPNVKIGGLYGTPVGSDRQALPWSRAEQAAFLITIGRLLLKTINKSSYKWAKNLRTVKLQRFLFENADYAFYGEHSLLSHDQGIRAFLNATNDLCFVMSDELKLGSWGGENYSDEKDDQSRITKAINSLNNKIKIKKFLQELAKGMASFDWRASSTPGLSEDEQQLRAAFRGSGGYKVLRQNLIRHLAAKGKGDVAKAAKKTIQLLKY